MGLVPVRKDTLKSIIYLQVENNDSNDDQVNNPSRCPVSRCLLDLLSSSHNGSLYDLLSTWYSSIMGYENLRGCPNTLQ